MTYEDSDFGQTKAEERARKRNHATCKKKSEFHSESPSSCVTLLLDIFFYIIYCRFLFFWFFCLLSGVTISLFVKKLFLFFFVWLY